MDAPAWQLVGVLSIPHVLYAFIWFRPALFRSLCGRADAVTTFARIAAALKGAPRAQQREAATRSGDACAAAGERACALG